MKGEKVVVWRSVLRQPCLMSCPKCGPSHVMTTRCPTCKGPLGGFDQQGAHPVDTLPEGFQGHFQVQEQQQQQEQQW